MLPEPDISRKAKVARKSRTYRSWRRNNSDLNRDRKEWYGVETKPMPQNHYIPLVKKTSERGETHYVELW